MDARRHWLCAGLLVALATAVQGWCVSRAEVPALDAVRYIGIAQSIDAQGWRATLADEAEHPLFPGLVALCRRAWLSLAGDSPSLWLNCAQLVSATMIVLAVVPLYFFSLRGAGEGPALAAGAFYCLMIEFAGLGADALGDSTQLFFLAGALWSLARFWNARFTSLASGSERHLPARQFGSSLWLAVFGVCTALAMMARAESCLLLAAVPLTMFACQARAATRQPWRRLATAASCLAAGWLVVMVPYLWSANSLAPRAALCRVLGREQPEHTFAAALRATPPAAPRNATSKELRLPDGEAATFGVKDRNRSTRFHGHLAALRAVALQLPVAANFWIGGLAVCGMWLACRRPLRPLDAFVAVFGLTYLVSVTHMAAGLGYLMPRHLLPLVLVILPPAGFAACELGRRIAAALPRQRMPFSGLVPAALVLAAALACLPRLLVPPHASHAGHRAAGEWLATQRGGAVLDSRGWTSLFSGRPTLRFDSAEQSLRDPSLSHVVVEQRELEADSPRGRTLRHVLAATAPPRRFAAAIGLPSDSVLVFCWPPQRPASLMQMTSDTP